LYHNFHIVFHPKGAGLSIHLNTCRLRNSFFLFLLLPIYEPLISDINEIDTIKLQLNTYRLQCNWQTPMTKKLNCTICSCWCAAVTFNIFEAKLALLSKKEITRQTRNLKLIKHEILKWGLGAQRYNRGISELFYDESKLPRWYKSGMR
jgi:hypothetical protein